MFLDDLKARMDTVRAAIERNAKQSAVAAAGRTSGFWAEMFSQRPIYPDLNGLMTCRREGVLLGAGDDPQGSHDRERAYSERVHHIFKGMVPKGFIAGLPESTFGSPWVFEHDGISRSANFWMNAATTRRVIEFVGRYGPKSPLRVLEIGPGWGACAYQLHNSLEIDSYTLVDLPENLYLSTLHLGSVLPERNMVFLDVSGPPIVENRRGTINACLPAAIGRIQAQYDLVLNSFSLQEMDLETVNAYIDWIPTILSPQGIFVSLNSHAKAGVSRPADYRYGTFHIHHWGVFRTVPSGFYNSIPYEVVLGRRRADSPDYPLECLNGLGWLMQIGLDRDLSVWCERLVEGRLDDRQRRTLGGYAALFGATDDKQRMQILASLKETEDSAVWLFVAALLALVCGDCKRAVELLNEALTLGLWGFAGVRAEVFLAGLARGARRSAAVSVTNGLDPLIAYPEARHIVETGDLDRAIDHINRSFGRKQSVA